MEKEEIEHLKGELKRFGLGLDFDFLIETITGENRVLEDAKITEFVQGDRPGQHFINEWNIAPAGEKSAIALESIHVSYRQYLSIPNRVISGIDLKDLERAFRKIDFYGNNAQEGMINIKGSTQKEREFVLKSFHQLGTLIRSKNPEANQVADRFQYNFLLFTPLWQGSPRLDAFKSDHLRSVRIDPQSAEAISVEQAHNILEGRYVRSIAKDSTSGRETFKWLGADLSVKDKNGHSRLSFIDGSESFDLPDAIGRTNIKGATMVRGDYLALHRLCEGEVVVFPMERGDVQGVRFFYADPVKGQLTIDQAMTEWKGYYKKEGISRDFPTQTPSDSDNRSQRRS